MVYTLIRELNEVDWNYLSAETNTASIKIAKEKPTHIAIAEAMRRQIASGHLRPGDSLPSERDLSNQLGVGRTTLRQAIRLLADEGWIDTKLGRGGGSVILENDLASREDLLTIIERYRTTVQNTYELRLALEPAAAALAATRATDDQIRSMYEILEETARTVHAYHSLDSRLHILVATASGNGLIVEAVENSRARFFSWANVLWLNADWQDIHVKRGILGDEDVERAFGVDHLPIVSAISERKPEKARAAMARHLNIANALFDELLGRLPAAHHS